MNDKELASLQFHDSAVRAYIASRMTMATTYLLPIALYNAHLACECLIKSLTAQSGQVPKKDHDLHLLIQELKAVNKNKELDDKELSQILEWLNPFQELGRYGALTRPKYDPDRIDTKQVKVFGPIGEQPSAAIKQIDYAFAKLYNLSSVGNDALKQASSTSTVMGWNYPIPLPEVVYWHNDYLKPKN